MSEQYQNLIRTIEKQRARIDALEAALRFMLTDPPATLDEPDTDAEVIQRYREIARDALAPEQDNGTQARSRSTRANERPY